MWNFRIVALTIVTIFALSGLTHTSPVGGFSLRRHTGIWYVMGMLLPEKPQNEILCDWFNLKAQYNCRGCFNERYGKPLTGETEPRGEGYGLDDGTTLTLDYQKLFPVPLEFHVTTYNNGDELLLTAVKEMKYSKLLSRNTTVSPETKLAFENLGVSAGLSAVFANPAKCPT